MQHFAKERRSDASVWLDSKTKTSKRTTTTLFLIALALLVFGITGYRKYTLGQKFQNVTTLAKRLKSDAYVEYSVNGLYFLGNINTEIPKELAPYVDKARFLPTPNSQMVKIQLILNSNMFGLTEERKPYTYTIMGLGTADGGQVWSVDHSDNNTVCPSDNLCSDEKLKLNEYFQTTSAL